MTRLNLLLTLTSLNVLLVTIERFSFTTKIILQPYNFLRLHEVIQLSLIILFTIVIPFFILKELTNNFDLLKTTKGTTLGALFIIGIYFYSTGNGVHEVASYLFNTFCPVNRTIFGIECGSMFFNDYYFGNILYFIGALLFTVPLLIFERMRSVKPYDKKQLAILIINAVVYALTIFAYAGFDRVLVGLVYSIIMTIIIDILLLTNKNKKAAIPFTLYSSIVYTLGTIASLIVRFH